MNVLGEIKQKRNYRSNEEFEEKHIWKWIENGPISSRRLDWDLRRHLMREREESNTLSASSNSATSILYPLSLSANNTKTIKILSFVFVFLRAMISNFVLFLLSSNHEQFLFFFGMLIWLSGVNLQWLFLLVKLVSKLPNKYVN